MRPRFEFGDEVRVTRNVRNDGTYPGQPTGALLLRRGSTGFVRDVGTFLQDQIIYSVHFIETGQVVGCREEELQPAADPWFPSRFEFRDKVVARLALGSSGRVLVEPGEVGEIVRVLKTPATSTDETTAPATAPDFSYHVYFPDRNTLLVPESALEPAPLAATDAAPSDPDHDPNHHSDFNPGLGAGAQVSAIGPVRQ